jgi:hypothetical protein
MAKLSASSIKNLAKRINLATKLTDSKYRKRRNNIKPKNRDL